MGPPLPSLAELDEVIAAGAAANASIMNTALAGAAITLCCPAIQPRFCQRHSTASSSQHRRVLPREFLLRGCIDRVIGLT